MRHHGPTFRETGHFNLDPRSHLHLPDRPGRYWLYVSVADYITDRYSFELKCSRHLGMSILLSLRDRER